MKLKNSHLFLGLVFTFGSFIYWWLPQRHSVVGLANAAFYMGQIFLFDYLSEKFAGFSLLKVKNRRSHFLLLGLIFGLILELYFNWLGKFWYYPYWNTFFYIFIFIPGFAVYSFYLLEVFLGTKAVLEYLFLRKKESPSFRGLKHFFTATGMLGTAIVSACTVLILTKLSTTGLKEAFVINRFRAGSPGIWYIYFAVFLGIWLVLEFFEYQRHGTSLLFEIYRKNYWPLLALLLAGVFCAFFYEIFNGPVGLWRYAYANAPWPNIKLFGFPVIVYIAWPFHLLPAFSLYRLLYKKESEQLWQ